MYSESNTHSRSELESVRSQKKKNRNCYRYQSVEPHSIEYNSNSNIDADAKIKQKIMEKYSKNPKKKNLLQQQMLSFNKTEVMFESKPKIKNMSQLDTSVNRYNNIYLLFKVKLVLMIFLLLEQICLLIGGNNVIHSPHSDQVQTPLRT